MRDSVRRENERGFVDFGAIEIFARLADEFGDRRDVTPPPEPRINVVHGGFLSREAIDGVGYGLLVPVPTDFGLVRRHNDCEDVPVTVIHHSRDDFAQVRRPVTKSGVDGNVDTSLGERGAERFGLFHRQFVERRESAELDIVLRDLPDALGFGRRRARDTFDETEAFAGTGVIFVAAAGGGTAECDEEYGIKIVLGHGERQWLVISG